MNFHVFAENWSNAAVTTLGMFWMAFWAFGLGYLISSMIQVFVTQKRMKETMGDSGVKSVALGTTFGFISSSCSFAALSTTRALFARGADLIASLSFLLASTNLVIELGIVISVFLSWQFVVGEYLGGILLIGLMVIVVKLTLPKELEASARERANLLEEGTKDEGASDWKSLIKSKEGWVKVAHKYIMEWKMVWKDVTIGFTTAGIIAAFVPQSFFESLFLGVGGSDLSFYQVLAQTLVGPIAAFFTFIGSMGNIPLAAVLFSNGVSLAGIMAFIFSDLVVFPILRIQSHYYGWKMALYILGVFLFILVITSLLMHYGFSFAESLPSKEMVKSVVDRKFFEINYTFYLNMIFLLVSGISLYQFLKDKKLRLDSSKLSERILFVLSIVSYLWLAGGVAIKYLVSSI